mgnify:CR=1 FL=1
MPWSPARIMASLESAGVSVQDVAAKVSSYVPNVRRVIKGESRTKAIEQCIADAVGSSRLDVFGPNKHELARAAAPSAEDLDRISRQLIRKGISHSKAALLTGFDRTSICYVLNGTRAMPKVWSALRALVGDV